MSQYSRELDEKLTMTLGHTHNTLSSANVSSKLVILNPPPVQHLHYIHHDGEEEDEEDVDEVYEVDPDYNPNEESDEGYRTTSSVTSGEKIKTDDDNPYIC